MAIKFVSFVGYGSLDSNKPIGYDETSYIFPDGKTSSPTYFVQSAIIGYFGPAFFDSILFFYTEQSHDRHKMHLENELNKIGIKNEIIKNYIIPTDDQDTNAQWRWFLMLFKYIVDGDEIVFDFTHGFRSVPIIFSAAINLLQTMRTFSLRHAYYGFIAKNKPGKIYDMAEFFAINEWAAAMRRFIDNADASALADVVARKTIEPLSNTFSERQIDYMRELSDRIKNVDVNNIESAAADLFDDLAKLEGLPMAISPINEKLLCMIKEKYGSILPKGGISKEYDEKYLNTQIALIKILVSHRLYMQAFTAMRECIATLGTVGVKEPKYRKVLKKRFTEDGRTKRQQFGDLFYRMLQYDEKSWKFEDKENSVPEKKYSSYLMPFFEMLREIGVLDELRNTVSIVTKLRNGFDHAWTSVSYRDTNIPEAAEKCIASLEKIISQIFMNIKHFQEAAQ